MTTDQSDFGRYVRRQANRGNLVVQPRMGFAEPAAMRAGLLATRHADATTAGTITLDAHTRVGRLDLAEQALREGIPLNGYPLVTHPVDVTRWVASVSDQDFPIQVRHGTALPLGVFEVLRAIPLGATEGGPVSYCLPYGRTPLRESITSWAKCCDGLAELRSQQMEPHLETFGGCMLGQLCPPGQLVAIAILEGLFFVQHGLRSISLSYAQQTNLEQDCEAVAALRRLCRELLPAVDWHVVIYAYMGVYPRTAAGGARVLEQAVALAVYTGAERLIVKTTVEAQRIPSVQENISALEQAAAFAEVLPPSGVPLESDSQTYAEAAAIVRAVLDLDDDLGIALRIAFGKGLLDLPFSLHPDNNGATRSRIDRDGWLRWEDTGSLPLRGSVWRVKPRPRSAARLLEELTYVQRKFDYESEIRHNSRGDRV
ncbi:methylaspartate mutase [Amycolatopsis acidiphila]|uniref:Methylaspartate mutase n=2 Tax=Amycolatopsis acidiphila TaxID=715473 RepID=A0A558AHI9_9PSEU|nr:methylaspartate mutase [Amycolatopsis acidiphila]